MIYDVLDAELTVSVVRGAHRRREIWTCLTSGSEIWACQTSGSETSCPQRSSCDANEIVSRLDWRVEIPANSIRSVERCLLLRNLASEYLRGMKYAFRAKESDLREIFRPSKSPSFFDPGATD